MSTTARLLVVNQFGVWLGFFLVVPFIAGHGISRLGISTAAVGLVLGWRTFVQWGLMLPAGLFADRVGLRRAILGGLAGRTIGLLMLAWADGLWGLLAGVTAFGIAGSLFSPATRAYLALEVVEHRADAFALFNAVAVLGSALGPLLAVAASPLGFDVTCYAAAGVFAVLAMAQARYLPPAPAAPDVLPVRAAVRGMVRARRLQAYTLASSGLAIVSNVVFLLLPLEAARLLRHDQAGTAGVFTLIAVTTVLLQLRLVAVRKRIGGLAATAAGTAVAGLGFLGIAATRVLWPEPPQGAGAVPPMLLIAAGTVLVAAGQALALLASQEVVADWSPPGQSAAGFGLWGFGAGLAAAAITPVVGRLEDAGHQDGLPWLAPVFVCATGLVSAFAVRLLARDDRV